MEKSVLDPIAELPIAEQEKVINIARIAHEANRQWCIANEDYSQPPWEDAPGWQRDSALSGVMFHLKHLKDGVKPSPAASHEEWLKTKSADGWKYGPVKDPKKKEHPCCVPYKELPEFQKKKDKLFSAIVEALQ